MNNVEKKEFSGKWGNIEYSFKVFRNREFKKTHHLISVSFFTLKDVDDFYAYQRRKTTHNKDFLKKKVQRYLDGIDLLFKRVKKESIPYTIRIYCDVTSIEYLQKYLHNKNLELYQYYFPQFFNKELNSHIRFFGTLMRYLPLFKLENHNYNEWETTTVLDVDLNFANEFNLMKYFIGKKDMPNIMFKTAGCYFANRRLKYMKINPSFFSIISSFFIQKVPVDFNIFTTFLENLLKDEYENYNRILDITFGQKREGRLMKARIEYGVDEYFLNKDFMEKAYLQPNRAFAEIFLNKKLAYVFVQWLSDLRVDNRKIENEKLIEQFIKVIVSVIFPADYKIKPYNNIKELIESVGEDAYTNEPKDKDIDLKKYKKLIELMEKMDLDKITMHKDVPTCMRRCLKLHPYKNTIAIVTPAPKYPEYNEKIIDFVKFVKN